MFFHSRKSAFSSPCRESQKNLFVFFSALQAQRHFLRGSRRGTGAAQYAYHVLVTSENPAAATASGGYFHQCLAHIVRCHAVGNKFLNYLVPRNEVYEGYEPDFEQYFSQERHYSAHGNVVANHLRHSEQSRFKSGRTGSYEYRRQYIYA